MASPQTTLTLNRLVNKHLRLFASSINQRLENLCRRHPLEHVHLVKAVQNVPFPIEAYPNGSIYIGGHLVMTGSEVDFYLSNMYKEIRQAASTNPDIHKELLS